MTSKIQSTVYKNITHNEMLKYIGLYSEPPTDLNSIKSVHKRTYDVSQIVLHHYFVIIRIICESSI